MDDTQRRILDEVAAGALSPDDAAALLRQLRDGAAADAADAPPATRDPGIRTLRVRCSLAEVRIIGDPTVAGAIADGPHEARTEGRTLVIQDRVEGRGFTFGARRGFVGIGRRSGQLEVRAHPDLDLEVELAAGELTVTGMRGPIAASVAAGSLELEGFRGPLKLKLKAGTVEGRGRLTSGASTVQCKLGEVRLDLDADSDVTVTARAKVGEVRLPDRQGGAGIDLREDRYVFGRGTATLEIDTAAGAVDIRSRG
ncbi:MAG: DUF4097 domain-containing protein [Actinobacteria bacterium]|nr:DUF4097 domain-containing protein [Actinomycetota bacterium]